MGVGKAGANSGLDARACAGTWAGEAVKIEYYVKSTDEIITDANDCRLFVFCDEVFQDNFESCESQSARVDFDDFIRERPDLGWRLSTPTDNAKVREELGDARLILTDADDMARDLNGTSDHEEPRTTFLLAIEKIDQALAALGDGGGV